MPTTLARDAVQEPERRHRPAPVGTPAARQPTGAIHSNGELARLARAGGPAPPLGLQAWSNRVARSSLAVTHPDDPVEREAERVASDVVHRRPVAEPSPPVTPAATTARRPAAREPDTAPAVAPPAPEAGSVAEHAEEIAEGGQVEVPQSVASLIASPGTGVPLEPAVQARVAPVLGADLSSVRVHQGPDASSAAAALQARAFTVGADIFLGEGESATDLELMAHESTHVVQQQAVGVYRAEVARLALGTVMPDWLIRDIQSIPGYSVVSTVVGSDPITGESATESRQGFVEKLLTFGPFGAASGPVLQAAKVLDDVFTMLDEGLKRHNLTFDRVLADLDSAWEEMSITEGVEFNLAIARRYLSAIVNDVKAFLGEIADAVIAKVRSVLAAVAEPLLEKDSIAPYWSLAKKVLHTNPLTGEDVPATTVDILTEFLKLIGQQKVLDQMIERGTLQKTADWVDSKIDQFQGIVGQVAALLEQAGAALSPANLPNLLDTLPALADQAFSIIKQIGDFAQDVIAQVLVLVKDSLLAWLSSYAKKIPGYELLTVILEKDPFTGDVVPRTAENLIKGFILLLPGGDAMYAKLAESGVIANAAGRITSAMTELNISWSLITDTFLGVWNLVTLESLLSPIETFDKILDQFGDPLERIIRFAAVVVQVVVELILRLMNFPPEIFGHILSQVESAIEDIKRDPVEFLLNVVEAMKQGFSRFFDNILEHLLKGLAAWMFRGLKSLGIETPTELTLEAAITLVIQVSGVTVELLWQRLAAKIGQEKVDKIREALELAGQAFDFIKDVQERGIEAIWDKISEQLSNLWDLIFDAAKSWIMKEIVNKAIAKVLSMLDPTGIMAVVNSCIAFFKAVQSVLDYMRELLELIDSYVSTVAQIAKGNVGPGAAMLETGLANAVPVAIGFLANQAGLGDVPEQVKQIIIDLRAKIVEAIDWLIDKAISLAKSALDALFGGEEGEEDAPPVWDGKFKVGNEDHQLFFENDAMLVASEEKHPIPPEVTEARALLDQIRVAFHQKTGRKKGEKTIKERDEEIQKLVDQVKALLIAHPDLWNKLKTGVGHAPNIGNVAPHGSQDTGWQPPKGQEQFMPYWALESEHVVPDNHVTALFEELVIAPTTNVEYSAMTTVMLYIGASATKTSTDAAARAALKAKLSAVLDKGVQTLVAIFEADSEEESEPKSFLDAVSKVEQEVWSAFDAFESDDAVRRSADAVIAEGKKDRPEQPGTASKVVRGGDDLPASDKIAQAAKAQLAVIKGFAFAEDQAARQKAYEAFNGVDSLRKALVNAKKRLRTARNNVAASTSTDPAELQRLQDALAVATQEEKDARLARDTATAKAKAEAKLAT
ncbi:eCIS core domain-containing protein [Cellulomonas terrae]|uniref:eCIS core domain-containing protein n=1 Tax=Cellulomonas terrae TaxID=311234 RepID=A0A511JPY3_9CELL|nr:DUF4157 domain-containing protein [Cellulomonas terrae]GEL99989.1 hypothetical protein CTE05_35360 [Cellulomonas terrae]